MDTSSKFKDRRDAGRKLVEQLPSFEHKKVVVIGLPRGGVPVAAEIARELNAPLDTIVIRKISSPDNAEITIGSIGPRDVMILDAHLIDSLGIENFQLEKIIAEEREELERREIDFKSGEYTRAENPDSVIIVDDGVATGSTAQVAIQVVHDRYPGAEVILAIPVCSPDIISFLKEMVDEVYCLMTPEEFETIGKWYADFGQVPDEDVLSILKEAHQK